MAKKTKVDLGKELKFFWEGKVSYGISFWVYFVLIATLISIPGFAPDVYWEIYPIAMPLYTIFLLVAKIYLIVGTWRSAEKYKILKKKKRKSTFWAYAGQVYIVLSIIQKVGYTIIAFQSFS
jgi:hypothetical protein